MFRKIVIVYLVIVAILVVSLATYGYSWVAKRNAASKAIAEANKAIYEADKSKADTTVAVEFSTSAQKAFRQGKFGRAKSEAETAKEIAQRALRALKAPPSEEEPPPIFPGGVQTWRQVAQKMRSDAKYKQLVKDVSGMSLDQVELLVVMQESGTKLITQLPAGTQLTNTGAAKDGGYDVYPGSRLKQNREALTDQNGNPKVLTKCGNPIREVKIVTMAPPSQGPPEQPPSTPPGKGPNTLRDRTTRSPQENPAGPTPGYPERGNAEMVFTQQQEDLQQALDEQKTEPITGGTTPTEFGTPGTDAGGSTPPGSDTITPSPDQLHDPGLEGSKTIIVGGTAGTSDPDKTEGSDQTSPAGSDPGGF